MQIIFFSTSVSSVPGDIRAARKSANLAFNKWKPSGFPTDGPVEATYRSKRKSYRTLLRYFLNNLENEKITKLCYAADYDEKLFWKLIKNQHSSSMTSAFLVDGNLITDKTFHRSKRKSYRTLLRKFFNNLENENITKLCYAADYDEKLFWKLIKNQRSSSMISAFLVDGNLITDKNAIRDMWATHFECLGNPSNSYNFDSDFLKHMNDSVKDIIIACTDVLAGMLSEPLTYGEISKVCSGLKSGVSAVAIDYEHIRLGPSLWKLFFALHERFFDSSSVPKTLECGVILPLYKGKGTKTNNKDNYWGITLFHTICKIYEIVLLNRLERHMHLKITFFRIFSSDSRKE